MQRLAGAKLAVDRVLVGVKVCQAWVSAPNDCWVRRSPKAAEAANCSAVKGFGMVEGHAAEPENHEKWTPLYCSLRAGGIFQSLFLV